MTEQITALEKAREVLELALSTDANWRALKQMAAEQGDLNAERAKVSELEALAANTLYQAWERVTHSIGVLRNAADTTQQPAAAHDRSSQWDEKRTQVPDGIAGALARVAALRTETRPIPTEPADNDDPLDVPIVGGRNAGAEANAVPPQPLVDPLEWLEGAFAHTRFVLSREAEHVGPMLRDLGTEPSRPLSELLKELNNQRDQESGPAASPFREATEGNRQGWRDFEHTVEVLIATGRAKYEITKAAKAVRRRKLIKSGTPFVGGLASGALIAACLLLVVNSVHQPPQTAVAPALEEALADPQPIEVRTVVAAPSAVTFTTGLIAKVAAPVVTAFLSVTGAPGDGNTALTAAMRRELSGKGLTMSDERLTEGYRVEGSVLVGRPREGKEDIRIDWLVTDWQGRKLGAVSMRNEVPGGSLDGPWGDVAAQVARPAAEGIVKLLPHAGPEHRAREPAAEVAAVPPSVPGIMMEITRQPVPQTMHPHDTPLPSVRPPRANAKEAPAPAIAPTVNTGPDYVALLSSQKSRMDALKAFADLQQKYSEALSDRTPDVQEVNLGENGVWYRVVVGPPGSRDAAAALCNQLQSAGYRSCWVTSY